MSEEVEEESPIIALRLFCTDFLKFRMRGMALEGRARFAGALAVLGLVVTLMVTALERGQAVELFGEEAGIGTFPGGQSTGGYREFDFEVIFSPAAALADARRPPCRGLPLCLGIAEGFVAYNLSSCAASTTCGRLR